MAILQLGNGVVENVSIGLLAEGYKKLDGNKLASTGGEGDCVFYMADANVPLPVMGQLSIVGVPRAYVARGISLNTGSRYKITGTVRPPNSTIYISNGIGTFESLEGTIIYSAVSDAEGNWVIEVPKWGGDAIIWCKAASSAGELMATRFTFSAEEILDDGETVGETTAGGTEVGTSGVCATCDGAGTKPGTCSSCLGTGLSATTCEACGGTGVTADAGTDVVHVSETISTVCDTAMENLCYYKFTPTEVMEVRRGMRITLDGLTMSMISLPTVEDDASAAYFCDMPMVYIGNYNLLNKSYPATDQDWFYATGVTNAGEKVAVFVANNERTTEVVISDASCSACSGAGRLFGTDVCPTCDGAKTEICTCPTCKGSGSANICLTGDTMIALCDGTTKRLDEIAGEDVLLGGDGSFTKVVALMRGEWSSCYTEYLFDDGTVIKEVREHRFYNFEQSFWQKLKNWRIGEHALRIDGIKVRLVAKKHVEEPREMFGLWTECGSYYANGLLSGDASANQHLMSTATVDKALNMLATFEEQELWALAGLEGAYP